MVSYRAILCIQIDKTFTKEECANDHDLNRAIREAEEWQERAVQHTTDRDGDAVESGKERGNMKMEKPTAQPRNSSCGP